MTENVEATGPRNATGRASAPRSSYEVVVHNVRRYVDPDTPDLVLRRSAVDIPTRIATEDITIIVREIDDRQAAVATLDPHSEVSQVDSDWVIDYVGMRSGDGTYQITRVVDSIIEEEEKSETPRVEFSNRYTKRVVYDCS